MATCALTRLQELLHDILHVSEQCRTAVEQSRELLGHHPDHPPALPPGQNTVAGDRRPETGEKPPRNLAVTPGAPLAEIARGLLHAQSHLQDDGDALTKNLVEAALLHVGRRADNQAVLESNRRVLH